MRPHGEMLLQRPPGCRQHCSTGHRTVCLPAPSGVCKQAAPGDWASHVWEFRVASLAATASAATTIAAANPCREEIQRPTSHPTLSAATGKLPCRRA